MKHIYKIKSEKDNFQYSKIYISVYKCIGMPEVIDFIVKLNYIFQLNFFNFFIVNIWEWISIGVWIDSNWFT